MSRHVQALVEQVEAGQLPAVAVLAGGERFFVDRALAALRRAALGEGPSGWNEDVFEGKATSGSRVVDAAKTLPMLASHRLVLVRDADALAAPELDKLADYIEAPSPSSCVVLVAEKLDGRTKLAKRATKLGLLWEAAPLKLGDLRRFVDGEAKRRGARLAADAAGALIDAVGNDLPALDDALERLSLYVGEGNTIGVDAVDACVAKLRVESIWALVDAVGMRDRRTALAAAASLLGEREPPLRILAMVARQLRIVGRMQAGLAAGLLAQDAAREAGAPPFKAQELAAAAKRMPPRVLSRAFAVLAETDLALKGSKQPPDLVLEGAILTLTARS
ncbi:MAG: DNA polymerase III subunit delta [Polyangiales bacterium]